MTVLAIVVVVGAFVAAIGGALSLGIAGWEPARWWRRIIAALVPGAVLYAATLLAALDHRHDRCGTWLLMIAAPLAAASLCFFAGGAIAELLAAVRQLRSPAPHEVIE